MGMGGGGGTNRAVSEINVTPLIDVLLVLLIIFMVIVPVTPHGLDALVPQPPKKQQQDNPNDRTIVLSILGDAGAPPTYMINSDKFVKADVEGKLQAIYSARSEKVMFIKGDPGLNYGSVAEAIDWGHKAGVDTIGIITPRVAAGQ